MDGDALAIATQAVNFSVSLGKGFMALVLFIALVKVWLSYMYK